MKLDKDWIAMIYVDLLGHRAANPATMLVHKKDGGVTGGGWGAKYDLIKRDGRFRWAGYELLQDYISRHGSLA